MIKKYKHENHCESCALSCAMRRSDVISARQPAEPHERADDVNNCIARLLCCPSFFFLSLSALLGEWDGFTVLRVSCRSCPTTPTLLRRRDLSRALPSSAWIRSPACCCPEWDTRPSAWTRSGDSCPSTRAEHKSSTNSDNCTMLCSSVRLYKLTAFSKYSTVIPWYRGNAMHVLHVLGQYTTSWTLGWLFQTVKFHNFRCFSKH